MSAGTNQVGILEFWLTCRLRGINISAHLRSIKSYHLGSSELDSSALSKGAVAIEFWVFYMLMQVWCGLTLNFSREDGSLDTYKKLWQIYPFRTQWVRTKPICWPDLSHRPPAYKFWFKCKKKKWNHSSAAENTWHYFYHLGVGKTFLSTIKTRMHKGQDIWLHKNSKLMCNHIRNKSKDRWQVFPQALAECGLLQPGSHAFLCWGGERTMFNKSTRTTWNKEWVSWTERGIKYENIQDGEAPSSITQ